MLSSGTEKDANSAASKPVPTADAAFRMSLRANVAAEASRVGFESASKVALESLVEMLQSYMSEIARMAQLYCEHGGRTIATHVDVIMALANAGVPLKSLLEYAHEECKGDLVGQVSLSGEHLINSSPQVLQVGSKRKFPTNVPDTFNYPPLPDPHTYIRTTTGVKSESNYVILRERSASNKRDMERALTQFVARTGKSYSLMSTSSGEPAYSLIDQEPSPDSYIDALLPSQEDLVRIRDFESKNDDPTTTTTTGGGDDDDEGGSNTNKKDEESSKDEHGKDKKSTPQRGGGGEGKQRGGARMMDQVSPSSTTTTTTAHHNLNNPFLTPVKRAKQKKRARR